MSTSIDIVVYRNNYYYFNIYFTGFIDETPRDYQCNLGPDGRRRDADERAELCRGTVEFVATREFLVRNSVNICPTVIVN